MSGLRRVFYALRCPRESWDIWRRYRRLLKQARCLHAWTADPATGHWKCMWCDVPSDAGAHPGVAWGPKP